MNEHVRFARRPQDLSSPILVCAFAGWNDGGEAATTALRYVAVQWSAESFAVIDPEEFFDFQVNRPTVTLEDGVTRRLTWPTCEFSSASPLGQDLALLLAVEPNVRWRSFTRAILDVAAEIDASSIVTLGAFLADVPHTRPAPVAAASADDRWAGRLGITPSTYEGPTGIVGVLHDAANAAGISSVSLWAAAPHYLPSGTNPSAALSLLRKLSEVLGVPIETDEMETAVSIWQRQVREAIEEDPALVSYVEQLEEAAGSAGDIPSGDQLVAELERYLRERPDGSGP
jgi:predicted ATP-grasp superfamily ATP-dependent carboligase